MAVSKQVLGMNARNFLYIRKYNRPTAKAIADDKMRTKERLLRNHIPTPGLLAKFRTLGEARDFSWDSLPKSFVLKPAHGYGGEGIVVVQKWDGESGVAGSEPITAYDLESNVFDIIDGAHSIDNLPDTAFIEDRVVPHQSLKKISAGGVADVRVIVHNSVPVMAMLRLPTEMSGGRANLHMGALGVGVDIRTGITTLGIMRQHRVDLIPGTKTKVRGIKVPDWEQILRIATNTQRVSGLGFAGVDIVLDAKNGPLVLEVNARPGLAIQLANGASLRTRLERLSHMKVPTAEHGIELAKRLFAETALSQVSEGSNILKVIEKVTLYGESGKKVVNAKIDTGAYRTSVDAALVEELGLEVHHEVVRVRAGVGTQERDTVKLKFRLHGREIDTIASYTDRTHMTYPIIIGRRDLAGFLVDPSGMQTALSEEQDE